MTRLDVALMAEPRTRPEILPREWSVEPDHGFVQGPLDLAAFAGQPLALTLRAGQVAVVERPGEPARTLDAGRHLVPGSAGRLTFLHVGRPLAWRWRDGSALWLGRAAGRRPVPIIGACTVAVIEPLAFHRCFLAAIDTFDESSLRDVVDALVRDRLEGTLGHASVLEPAAVQSLLARLQAADLTESLAEYGLACLHLAVYTRMAPVAEASPAFAGHLGRPDDNGE